MSDQPTQLPAVEVELDKIELNWDNSLWVRLRFADNSYLSLEFAPDSAENQQLLELIGRGASDAFRRLGQRGVTVTGFTPPDEPEDGT